MSRYGLRFAALAYLAMLLLVPLGMVFWRTFEHGFWPAFHAVTAPDARSALWLTVLIALIVGLALLLLYGRLGWLGPWLGSHGIKIIYALPGMVLATIFVSLPFVVREVVPVLREIGTEQEQAAATLGASRLQ